MRFPDTLTYGTVILHRRQHGRVGWQPYHLGLVAERPLDDEEMARFAQAVGYAWAEVVRGESLLPPERVDDRSFVLFADSTKSRRTDLGVALEQFEQAMSVYVQDGSPLRKTDRAGAGTKGTRLVEGIPGLRFALYYDNVLTSSPA